jgi:hypothetical protein
MTFVRILVVAVAIIEAGWMTFDGTRALTVGDYVTPRTGPHAGQLGQWHYLADAVGIPPRSTVMKLVFVVYGLTWLFVIAAFLRDAAWGWTSMLIAAVGALWYLPVGTACSLAQIVGLLWLRRAA